MAGVGRLPRVTIFAQSGGWQARRSPRRSTLGPDREGEQPAMSRRSRQAAHRQSNGVAAILAAPVIERIANHLGLPARAPASRPTLQAA